MTFIQTASGRKFDFLTCTEDDIEIVDIAHALSNLCRYSGHIPSFYSVAQHCIEMSYIAPPEFQLDALMHDASEAYLGDVTKHLKQHLGMAYKVLEDRVSKIIASKYDLSDPMPAVIKKLDGDMLETEFKQIWKVRDPAIPSYGTELLILIRPMPPGHAKQIFLSRFYNLEAQRRRQAVMGIANSP